MIRRLRRKLILACMLSLAMVLLVIVGAINIANYRGIVEDADSVLELLLGGDGRFPEPPTQVDWTEAGPRFQSPELRFEARFFSALTDADGNLLSTDVGQIAAVDSESVAEYAQRALSRRSASGFVDSYRYLRAETEDGVRIIFLDCGRMLAGSRAVLLSSLSVSAAGLAAVFLLAVLASGHITKPVSVSYEKQKRFITDAGHEIKTPITIIDADAELLEMELGPNEWIDDIRAQARRLTALTGDLICLARMEEAENLPMIDFPISDLAAETAASFQGLALTRNRTLELSIQPMLSCRGDDKSIAQLISILLDNAVKYSSDEGSIRLSLDRAGKNLRLTVENAVDELSRETVDSMFDRFFRGDPSRSSGSKGYGIGLSIARAIVEAHKGRISAETDGRSLKITVLLPQ